MAFDGNGNYNPPAPEYPLQPQTVISSADMNTLIQDIANALGNCMTRDSQGAPSVDLNLFTKKIVNLGAATNPNDAMRKVDVETYAITATTDRDMAGYRLKNLPASPTAGTDAVSANYVNTAQADRSMAGFNLVGAPAGPYAADEYVPKQYVDDQDALKASLNGANYTGTQDFTGGTALVTTQAPTDSTTKAASTAFVQSIAMNASLPGLVGNALKYLRVDVAETTAEWVEVDTYRGRSARTSNTILVGDDIGKLIDITSGTFTQTFTAAATLGAKWWCYLRNSGTGDITLDPNGSEQIDGLTSYVMYPGETRLVTCNGTGFYTIVLTGYFKTFTASNTWVKPPGYAAHSGYLWAGGGGGSVGSGTYVAGSGGGSCLHFTVQSSALAASVTVIIGGGGSGSTNAGAGGNGGNSSFSSFTAYGGAGAAAIGEGGSGGGLLGAGGNVAVSSYTRGGLPADKPSTTKIHNEGGGGGAATADYTSNVTGGSSVWGGGGGGCSGGGSVWGGGGGGGTTPPTMAGTGGTSLYGGSGGAGFYGAGTAASGTAPGGAGGSVGNSNTGQGGAGARGELRIWGVL